MASNPIRVVATAAGVGTLSTLCLKSLLSQPSINARGEPVLFTQPVFASWLVFLGMSLLIVKHCLRPTPLRAVFTKKFCRTFGDEEEAREDQQNDLTKKNARNARNDLVWQPLLGNAGYVACKRVVVEHDFFSLRRHLSGEILFWLLVANFLDILALTTTYSGLPFIPASVWLMLRGSQIAFSHLLRTCYRWRNGSEFFPSDFTTSRRTWTTVTQTPNHRWVGVCVAVVGVFLVGWAELSAAAKKNGVGIEQRSRASAPRRALEELPSGDLLGRSVRPGTPQGIISGHPLPIWAAVALVVNGQIFEGVRRMVEELLLKKPLVPLDPAEVDGGAPRRACLPIEVVCGLQGVLGSLFMPLLVFPFVYYLQIENPFDSFVLIKNDEPWLPLLAIAMICAAAVTDLCSATVSWRLNTVHRAMADGSRAMIVWGVCLFYHYAVNEESAFGQAWVAPWSWVQLAAFWVLVLGQVIYGGGLGEF